MSASSLSTGSGAAAGARAPAAAIAGAGLGLGAWRRAPPGGTQGGGRNYDLDPPPWKNATYSKKTTFEPFATRLAPSAPRPHLSTETKIKYVRP